MITEDPSWQANTDMVVKKAFKRMCILRKLFEFKVKLKDLKQIYTLYIRSVVEQSCVVWSHSLTQEDEKKIERVQKIALRIILKENYQNYDRALEMSVLQSLKARREILCSRFARKCTKSEETVSMFPLNNKHGKTRQEELYNVPFAYTDRLKRSAIPSMARLLNKENAS